MDLHISLPPTSFSLAPVYTVHCPQSDSSWKWAVSISQTLPVVWKESCFSLALCLFFCLVFGGNKAASLYFCPLGAPGNLTPISNQTNIHAYVETHKHKNYLTVLLCSHASIWRRSEVHKSHKYTGCQIYRSRQIRHRSYFLRMFPCLFDTNWKVWQTALHKIFLGFDVLVSVQFRMRLIRSGRTVYMLSNLSRPGGRPIQNFIVIYYSAKGSWLST